DRGLGRSDGGHNRRPSRSRDQEPRTESPSNPRPGRRHHPWRRLHRVDPRSRSARCVFFFNLQTQSQRIGSVTSSTESGERKIVTFSLSKRTFGIDMSALIEIREWEQPTPLPRVPSYIKGVANLRGNVIPIVGLAERLGWEPSVPHARSC